MREKPTVIIQRGPPLTAAEMKEAFSISRENKLYRGFLQIFDQYLQERSQMAASFMNESNTLGMAGCNGAVDVINTILLDVEARIPKERNE